MINPRLSTPWWMAYSAEWDGYDRDWHARFAVNRAELDALIRGANQAAREITESEKA